MGRDREPGNSERTLIEWVLYLPFLLASLVSAGMLIRHAAKVHRGRLVNFVDAYILLWLGAATWCFCFPPARGDWTRWFALYRLAEIAVIHADLLLFGDLWHRQVWGWRYPGRFMDWIVKRGRAAYALFRLAVLGDYVRSVLPKTEDSHHVYRSSRTLTLGVLTFVELILQFGFCYFHWSAVAAGKDSAGHWILATLHESLYFSTITFTTLGYGDLLPIPGLRGWAMAEAVLGVLFGIVLLGRFVAALKPLQEVTDDGPGTDRLDPPSSGQHPPQALTKDAP